MSDALNLRKMWAENVLRSVADKRGIKIERVHWEPVRNVGPLPPSYRLEVCTANGASATTLLTAFQMTLTDTTNHSDLVAFEIICGLVDRLMI